MTNECRFETHVVQAAATNDWSESLRAHVASCADCAAAAMAAPFMSAFASFDDRTHALPDPALLWLKARLMQNRAAVERVSLPITRAQIAAYVVVAACWAALLTWKSAALESWIGGKMLLTSLPFSLSVVVTVLMLASATVVLAMHTILAEE